MNIKTTLWRPLSILLVGMIGLIGNLSAADVTFSVDMNTYSGTFSTVQLSGSLNGWCGCEQMAETAPGSGIYTVTVTGVPAGNVEYKFTVDALTPNEYYETLTSGSSCTVTAGGFTNRFLTVGAGNIVLDTVCFEECVACDITEPTYMVTVQVDMNNYSGPYTSVQLAGGFNGWCADCSVVPTQPLPGVFSFTLELEASDIEYKFVARDEGGTGDYFETLAEGPCTIGTTFINRSLSISGDVTLDVVCFESCEACDGGGLQNDNACGALEVTVDGGPITADNTGATPDGPFPDCWVDTGVEADIWYFFTAPSTGSVEIETIDTGANDDTQVAVYGSSDGTCTGSLTEVGCGDDISTTNYMTLFEVSSLTPGDTYWIQVDGWQGTDGEFELDVRSTGVVDCPAPDAVICDNIDSYTLGVMNGQGAHWSTWSGNLGGAEDAIVTDEQAFSNNQSVLIAEGQSQDVLLLLGDESTGNWTLDWMMYVPSNATAYYNFQGDPNPGTSYITEVRFNANSGAPGEGVVSAGSLPFSYPEDQWFSVEHDIDLDNDLMTITIDGVEVGTIPYTNAGGDLLSSVDFFSIDAANRYYIDDVVYDGSAGVDPCPAPDALICDNFDTYDLGDADWINASYWAPWPGGTVVSNVVNDQAFSNSQSLNVGPGGAEDQLLLLGNQTTGLWTVDFMMYIPAGANGYYNMQNTEATGAWNFDIFFDTGGVGDYQESQASISSFTWPEDTWFQMSHTVDLNNSTVVVELDGVEIHSGPYAGDQVGAINFYSIDGTNNYYLDDVVVDGDPAVGLTEFVEGNFRIYPNPTGGLFTVEGQENIEAVVVRNVLGATVAQLQSNFSNRVELDLTGLNNGLYFVEITVNDVVSVQRLIKQ